MFKLELFVELCSFSLEMLVGLLQLCINCSVNLVSLWYVLLQHAQLFLNWLQSHLQCHIPPPFLPHLTLHLHHNPLLFLHILFLHLQLYLQRIIKLIQPSCRQLTELLLKWLHVLLQMLSFKLYKHKLRNLNLTYLSIHTQPKTAYELLKFMLTVYTSQTLTH